MNINTILFRIIQALAGNLFVRLLLVMICADLIFGSLRAIKYHRWNSAVGIDGCIRKVGMVSCVLLLTLVDMVIAANVLSWLPDQAQTTLSQIGIVKLGFTELFALLFVLYEATSVLKNMLLCGVPIPAGVRTRLAKWLESMTDETDADLISPEPTIPEHTE